MYRKCEKCKITKPHSDFYKNKTRKYNIEYICKMCSKKRAQEKVKQRKLNHQCIRCGIQLTTSLKICENCLNKNKQYKKTTKGKESIKKTGIKHRQTQQCKIKRRYREKTKRKNNIQYKLSQNLRSRLNHAIKNKQKIGSAVQDLGCSIEELIIYLEQKFQPGMTWENWGKGEDRWNIDHIIPVSSFDLTNREQFLQCCHYTNLQPLWEKDNLIKGGADEVPSISSRGKEML